MSIPAGAWLRASAAIALALPLAGCGNSLAPGLAADARDGVDPALIDTSAAGSCDFLDPSVCLYPFPNDYFTVADPATATGRRLNLQLLAMPRSVAGKPIDPSPYNREDGFSPGQMILTRVPGLDSPEAMAATGAVPINDLARYADPDQPILLINAATGERQPIWSEVDLAENVLSDGDPPPAPANRALIIRPAVNFAEGARYIVALRRLRDAQGNLLEPGAAFRVYRDSVPTDNPAIEARRAHFEEIFATLADAGIDRDDLYLAWDFTVASQRNLSERMLYIRDDAFAALGDFDLGNLQVEGGSPEFSITNVTDFAPCSPEGCAEGQNDRLLRRVEGKISVPCYLDVPGCVIGGQFLFQPGTNLPLRIPGNTYSATFICNIPRWVARDGNVTPAKPSLYGHGLFGSADEVDSGKLADLGNSHGYVFCGADFIGMSETDIPVAVTLLVDLSLFPTLADRMQQGMLDFLYIGRALIHPQGFGSDPAFQVDGQSVIDTSRLYYYGGSQGGIVGGALASVAPDFKRALLGVPAMNYSTLLQRSVDFDTYAQVMYRTYQDELERPLLFSMIEMLWQRAEANGYAHHISGNPYPNTPDHTVLMEVAYGDHQVTNWAAAVEARTIGARIRTPILDPGRSNEVEPFWGIPPIESLPYAGSAIVVSDVGPLRQEGDEEKGTPPPPIPDVPNRLGVDPHGPDATETQHGKERIAAFLQENGVVIDTCGGKPCYLDGYAGP